MLTFCIDGFATNNKKKKHSEVMVITTRGQTACPASWKSAKNATFHDPHKSRPQITQAA